jgi:hypothetical protein
MMMNKKGYSKGGASGKTISDADKARVAFLKNTWRRVWKNNF